MTHASRQNAAAPGRQGRQLLDEVRAALAAAGCRFTAQRGAVWSYLASVEDHPTAEQVFRAVRRRVPQISLATVYNALEALVEARLATKITSGDGSARYDCRGEDHYHLRDVETGGGKTRRENGSGGKTGQEGKREGKRVRTILID